MDVGLDITILATKTDMNFRFQEHTLCRRALYFVDNKVFFRCRTTEHSESCVDPPGNMRSEADASFTLREAIRMDDPLEDYVRFLSYYTKRALSNQEDALRALAGITRRVSEKLGYQFIQGLPTGAWDAFITFKANDTVLRRRRGFPSYSWSGWQGEISIDLANRMNEWLTSRTWIVWYERSHLGVANPLWDPTANEMFPVDDESYVGYRQRRLFQEPMGSLSAGNIPRVLMSSSISTTCTIPTDNISFRFPPFKYPILQFWTLAVYCKTEELDVFTGKCNLVGQNGANYGSMVLDGFQETTFFDSGGPFELILLSEWGENALTWDASWDASERWQLYSVMLLEWSEGIAERRGIGQIWQSGLVKSFPPGPVWKEILLG
jgi:hypothetical protein